MNIKKYKNYLFLLPFLFLFLILLDWHYSIGLSADDLFFYTIPQESDIISFVTERYDIWSSRTLIEYVLCHILQLPLILWWYLDSLIFTFIGILTFKLIDGKNKIFYATLSCVLCLSFIFSSYYALSSAGFITTSINYAWPLFSGLLAIYILKNYTANDTGKIKRILAYIISVLCLLFAVNNEQLAVILLGLFVLYYLFNYKTEINKKCYLIGLSAVIGIINTIICPGVPKRFISELKWFHDYLQLNLLNKLNIGLSSIINRCVTWCDLTTLILLGIIAVSVYLLTKNKKKAMISLIPFIIASGFWILTLTDNLMLLQIMNANITRYGYVPISLKRMILSLTIYGIFIMTFLYGLYIIYKNQKSVLWPVYSIMFVGFASTIMFGFTPSIPSMERMYIFFYYGNMLAILIFIKQIIEKRIKT